MYLLLKGSFLLEEFWILYAGWRNGEPSNWVQAYCIQGGLFYSLKEGGGYKRRGGY